MKQKKLLQKNFKNLVVYKQYAGDGSTEIVTLQDAVAHLEPNAYRVGTIAELLASEQKFTLRNPFFFYRFEFQKES
jgi:hypothetical protein